MNFKHPIVHLLFLFCGQILAFGQMNAPPLPPQTPGFVFTYPDAEGYTGSQIVQTDTGYLVTCSKVGSTSLLTTDTNGLQVNFEILSDNPPSTECTMPASACLYPVAGAAVTQPVTENEYFQFFKDPGNWLRFENHTRDGCCDASSEVQFSMSYPFEKQYGLFPRGVVVQGADRYLYGHQHLGEFGGGFADMFRVWVIKTDSVGHEIWRAHSSQMNSYQSSGSTGLAYQLPGGGIILRFTSSGGMSPNLIQFNPDGSTDHILSGGPTNLPSSGGSINFDQYGNRFIQTVTSTPSGHSTSFQLRYRRPDGTGFTVGYASGTAGIWRATEDGGLVLAHGNQYDPIFTLKNYALDGTLEWSQEYPFAPTLASMLVTPTGHVLLTGKLGSELFLLRHGPGANYPMVDFEVSSIELPQTSTAMPGDTVLALVRVGNTASVGLFYIDSEVGVFLSENDIWDSGDQLLTSMPFTAVVPVPGFTTVVYVPIPASLPVGDYHLIAVADPDQFYIETNDANNSLAVPLTVANLAPPNGPKGRHVLRKIKTPTSIAPSAPSVEFDLSVFGPWYPSPKSFSPGETVNLDFDLKNYKDAVSGLVQLDIYLRSLCDTSLLGGAILLESLAFADLPAESSLDVEIALELPPSTEAGFYEIVLWADAAETVAETHECNNFKLLPIEILAETDVELTLSTPTDSVGLHEWFTVTATLSNVGPEVAGQLWVHWPAAVGAKHPIGTGFTVSQGSFAPHLGRMWNVGTLLPGETAILEVDFIRKDTAAITLFAQVQNSQQADLDSSPGNAACCTPTEDDEAAVTLVPMPAPTPPDTPDSLAWMLGTASGQPNVQVLESLQMEISPNPARTAAWISFSLENEGIVGLQVLDVHGVILSQAFDNQIFAVGRHRMEIELDELLPGVYFVALRTAEGIAVRRLVKG